MNQSLVDYFRLPPESIDIGVSFPDRLLSDPGFFRFTPKLACFGRSESAVASTFLGSENCDVFDRVCSNEKGIHLPFDFDEVIDNLRLERYRGLTKSPRELFPTTELIRKIYYFFRAAFPVRVRRHLQKIYFRDWKNLPFPAWPVDFTVDDLHRALLRLMMECSGVKKVPFVWFWPDGASSCLIMTHDVETSSGRDFTATHIDIDLSFGINSSFQVIPEKRYDVPDEYVALIRGRGCEFNVHDLNHDGHLYQERSEFLRRAARINSYIRKFKCDGFRAGAMYRNQDWYDVFEFSYDMSVPNVAHLEPMRGGCCTAMPYFVGKIVELPLTCAQDYSLFHILNDYSIELWKRQIGLLQEKNALISFITHPDYLIEEKARGVYEQLLDYLRQVVERDKIWSALPGEVNRWWRARSQMRIVRQGSGWAIEGPEKERARLAYATMDRGKLIYELA